MNPFSARYGSALALFLAFNTSAEVCTTISSFESFDATNAPLPITLPVSINAQLEIAGNYQENSFGAPRHGFFRNAYGQITTFDAPDSVNTQVTGMNNKGEIVGFYVPSSGGSGGSIPSDGYVRHKDGDFITFGLPDAQIFTAGINSEGEIVGYALKSSPTLHYVAFVRSKNGDLTTFDVPGAGNTLANGVNDHGEIAGWSGTTLNSTAFVRSKNGALTPFLTISSAALKALTVNNKGEIAGVYKGGSGLPLPPPLVSGGFLRGADGLITTFYPDPPVADSNFFVNSTNDNSYVVGAYTDTKYHAFVWAPGGKFTAFDAPDATTTVTNATGINNNGLITGYYTAASGTHGYLAKIGCTNNP